MTLGANILRIRTEKNLSAQKLGQLVGVSKQMIYQYEKDESVPGKEILDKLARNLGATVADLYSGKTPIAITSSSSEKKIMDMDVWDELRINSEELRRNNATFKQEIEKLWSEREKFWALIDRLTTSPEPRKAQKG